MGAGSSELAGGAAQKLNFARTGGTFLEVLPEMPGAAPRAGKNRENPKKDSPGFRNNKFLSRSPFPAGSRGITAVVAPGGNTGLGASIIYNIY